MFIYIDTNTTDFNSGTKTETVYKETPCDDLADTVCFYRDSSSNENLVSATDFKYKTLKKEKIKTISEFRRLPEGWNGYGAQKISDAVINKATSIVGGLSIPPKVFPTGRNSIQFEYEKPNGDYLEFEIFEEKIICLKIINEDEQEFPINSNSSVEENVVSFYVKK